MRDLWRWLTRGRAVSMRTHIEAVAAAHDRGVDDGRKSRRLTEYATPKVEASDNLTGAGGMAVWDDEPEPETAA